MAREAHVKPSVWRRYRGDCRRFCVFRETEFGISGDVGPPFNLEHVLAWLGVMIAEKVDSAATAIAGLSKFQVRAGAPPLRDDIRVQEALAGWARSKPLPVKKQPLTRAMIDEGSQRWDVATLLGARAVAMLSAGHDGALRGPSELLRARLPLRVVAHGAEIDVHSKTDVHVQHTSVRRISAAALGHVKHYLAISGHTSGWLFRSIRGGGTAARSSAAPVSATTLSTTVKECAERLGFDPTEFASHSLRHGAVDDFKSSGVPERVGMAVGGWASASAYRGYGGAAARRRSEAATRRAARELRQHQARAGANDNGVGIMRAYQPMLTRPAPETRAQPRPRTESPFRTPAPAKAEMDIPSSQPRLSASD